MKVIADTCVWSLALRHREKPEKDTFVQELYELIDELRVQMIGPIRQELLSGVRSQEQFEKLRDHLRAFDDLPLLSIDYERAADFYNQLRNKGIQGSNTDFLICAIATRHQMPILTTDKDFRLFKEHIPIQLHIPRPFSLMPKLPEEELQSSQKDVEDIRREASEHQDMKNPLDS